MKLAEALLLRAEYQQKMNALQTRIGQNLQVQENERPHEDPNVLLKELMDLNDKLGALVKKVNQVNMHTHLNDGRTLMQAIADRDVLKRKRQALASIVAQASERDYRMTHTEIKMVVTVDVASLQKELDQLSQKFRELDTQIQAQNWLTELE